MVKKYFVKGISFNKGYDRIEGLFDAKKENNCTFPTTSNFKFLHIKNYTGTRLSCDVWCKSMDCKLQKLVFPYEWLDNYEKLSNVGPVGHEDFYSKLKTTSTKHGYEQFLKIFKKNDCTDMGDWLPVYNVAAVAPLTKAH